MNVNDINHRNWVINIYKANSIGTNVDKVNQLQNSVPKNYATKAVEVSISDEAKALFASMVEAKKVE